MNAKKRQQAARRRAVTASPLVSACYHALPLGQCAECERYGAALTAPLRFLTSQAATTFGERYT